MKFHHLPQCNLNIVSLPMLERLFVIVKDDDKIICTSRKDTDNVVIFDRDVNGFYVYNHILDKSTKHICNSSHLTNMNITAMSLIEPHPQTHSPHLTTLPITSPTSPTTSPTLITTPEREIEKTLDKFNDNNIGLVEGDEDTEDRVRSLDQQ